MKILFLRVTLCFNLIITEIMGNTMTLWEADYYDENSKLQREIAQKFLDFLQKKEFPFQGHLLDIGCGTGRITSDIQSKFPGIRITGIDASKEMIEFANRTFAKAKVAFYQDRAEELKVIPPNSMDAVVSFSCLHWVHDLETAFQAMNRVLKPGGWVGAVFCADTGIDDPSDEAEAQAFQEEPWRDYFKDLKQEVQWNIVKPEIIRSQLAKAGFEIHFMGTLPFDFVFEDVAAFERWILGCFIQLKQLPPDLQLSCAGRIAQLYLEASDNFQPKAPHCIYRVNPFMFIAQNS